MSTIIPPGKVPHSFSPEFDIDSLRKAKAIVFDMDGTLVLPITKYLEQMRNELKVPEGIRTLTHVETLTEIDKQNAYRIIEEIEQKAKRDMRLQPVMVGDSTDDIECGINAGSMTVLLKNDVNENAAQSAHVVISRLDHIVDLLVSSK
ncbi:hypothetical protein BB561_004746 [Smittium simulii]|uniref:Uncharacterized protein n=1 Tax=Smittium simulii TaxID=133385 RepID=A0A2T9YEG6_9FUNG|nr:hypothetical protein BB561_004746 [Smittium simulii]